MSSSAAASGDVLHISTRFDDSVHEYQFPRSHPRLFAALQQLTAAKYPLSPVYIHYVDEDGDMVRVTNELELREAVRAASGHHLSLVLSSGLPSSSSASVASTTVAPHTPSASPTLTPAASRVPASSSHDEAPGTPSIDDIDDYLSSDDESLFEQVRAQVRASHDDSHSVPAPSELRAEAKAEVEVEGPQSPRFGVVALDSDGEEEDAAEQAPAKPQQVESSDADASAAAQAVSAAKHAQVEPSSAQHSAAATDSSPAAAEQPSDPLAAEQAAATTPAPSSSHPPTESLDEKVDTAAPIAAQSAESKEEDSKDEVDAITDRLRTFYQLDHHRQAITSAATTSTTTTSSPLPSPSLSPVPIASLLSSFFSDPSVVAVIRDNAALLTPLLVSPSPSALQSSSFALFVHQLCLLNPALSSHALSRYVFALSSLHPFTVCVHCSASPVVGRLLYCRACDATLCGACQQRSQHPPDHALTELPVMEYRRDPQPVAQADGGSGGVGGVRVDGESGRVLEERKASDFAELGDRMRASGQRAWKQGAVSLRKVDEVLTQFAAEVKALLERMLDSVVSDAPPRPAQQPLAEADEYKQQQAVLAPAARPLLPTACSVRRPSCLPSDKSYAAAAVAADRREPAIALAQPARQSMGGEQQPQRQQVGFAYRAQLDAMADMGLVQSAVNEETCKELLNASKGNVDQAVQWLMDKINV